MHLKQASLIQLLYFLNFSSRGDSISFLQVSLRLEYKDIQLIHISCQCSKHLSVPNLLKICYMILSGHFSGFQSPTAEGKGRTDKKQILINISTGNLSEASTPLQLSHGLICYLAHRNCYLGVEIGRMEAVFGLPCSQSILILRSYLFLLLFLLGWDKLTS